MIYGRDYQTGNPVCADGQHECNSIQLCAACDGEAFCEKHLTECEGCKKAFCAQHAAERLTQTNCGLICEDCCVEFAAMPLEQEEPEPVCECVQTDVDQFDDRGCPAHGPHSESARLQLQQEADDEFAYWSHPGWAKVFGKDATGR